MEESSENPDFEVTPGWCFRGSLKRASEQNGEHWIRGGFKDLGQH